MQLSPVVSSASRLFALLSRPIAPTTPLSPCVRAPIRIAGSFPRIPRRRTAIARALSTHLDPRGRSAAAARRLADDLVADTLLPAGRRRAILVTSRRAGEGKSFVAANLATALAQTGRRVLLVDASVRAPMQQQIWSLSGGAGAGDFAGCPDRCACAIQKSDVDRLDILPRGAEANRIGASACSRLLDCAADTYDHIVIDGPSLDDGCDAAAIARSCDAMLLVFRNRLPRADWPEMGGVRVLGVMNAV